MNLSRREFLYCGAAFCAGTTLGRSAQVRRPKAPFRLLYGNDLTNICACLSPFHRRGEPFTRAMLTASVEEAKAADAHLLQPGLTYVPLWKSRIYPPQEHFRWWQETFPGSPLHELGRYVLEGGDVVQDFVEACAAREVAPIISLRVNDYHRLEMIDAPAGSKLEAFDSLAIDRFRREYPEYRVQSKPSAMGAHSPTSKELFAARNDTVLNWAIPAVRERFVGLVSEVAQGYAIAGLELDFLRHFNLFRTDKTLPAERVAVVTGVIKQVRHALDARAGPRRWLGVRIPASLSAHATLGLDVAALVDAGVDILNLSSNYYTVQQDLDTAEIRRRAPAAAIYVEMTHCTMVGPDVRTGRGDNGNFRRTTAAQFYTTAELQKARGADGVSLFNFAYYRATGGAGKERGPFGEPPFEELLPLARSEFPDGTPHEYFLAPSWHSPFRNRVQLPLKISGAGQGELNFDIVAPAAGWLRVQTERPTTAAQWQAKLNGAALEATEASAVPRESHPALTGTPETTIAWRVPRSQLHPGLNTVTLTLAAGEAASIVFAQLILP